MYCTMNLMLPSNSLSEAIKSSAETAIRRGSVQKCTLTSGIVVVGKNWLPRLN
jgi:hypothetical protein